MQRYASVSRASPMLRSSQDNTSDNFFFRITEEPSPPPHFEGIHLWARKNILQDKITTSVLYSSHQLYCKNGVCMYIYSAVQCDCHWLPINIIISTLWKSFYRWPRNEQRRHLIVKIGNAYVDAVAWSRHNRLHLTW